RASSITGAGGHHTSSSSLLSLRLTIALLGFELSTRLGEDVPDSAHSLVGAKGTRNLRQDLSSFASLGSIDDACCGGPRRESKSEAVALGGTGGFAEDGGGLTKNGYDENE
ncbi:hypothetical protein U1Q18_035795, partial [Sarracenia purpurea var. burkii]